MPKERTFRQHATRGFAWNYLYKLTEFGLMNCYTILVVRHFGPRMSAPYAVFTALCTTISMICAFAVDGVLLRYIQRISANDNSAHGNIGSIEKFGLHGFLKTLFAFRILIVTAISFIIFIVFFLLPYLIPVIGEKFGSVSEFSPYMIVFLYAQAVVAFCTFSLIGLLETKRVFYASLFSRGLLLGGGLLLVFEGTLSLRYAVGLYIISAIVNAIFLLFALRIEIYKYTKKKEPTRSHASSLLGEIRRMVSSSRHIKLFLATPIMLYGITTWGSDILSTLLGRQPDILMMRTMLGENSSQISYYLAASLVLLVTEYIFLFGLGGTLVSIFSKLAHDDITGPSEGAESYPRLAKARREIAGLQNVVLLPLCAYMMVFAPDVVRCIYGDKYSEIIPMIRIGLIALAVSVGLFGGGMQITSLVAIGKERLVFRNRLYCGIANIIVNFFLIRLYGGVGAIIGTQFSNALACGLESYFARKIIGSDGSFILKLRIFFFASISALTGYYFNALVFPNVSPVINVCIGGIVVLIVTLMLYYVSALKELELMKKFAGDLLKKTILQGNDH